MTVTILKSKAEKEGLSERVRDPQIEVGDGNRHIPPIKPPCTTIATGGKDDDDKRRWDEMQKRMDREDWEIWEEEFDRYGKGRYE